MSGRAVGIGGGIAVHVGPSKVVPKKTKAPPPEPSADDLALLAECAGEAVETTCAAARKAGDLPARKP